MVIIIKSLPHSCPGRIVTLSCHTYYIPHFEGLVDRGSGSIEGWAGKPLEVPRASKSGRRH